MFLEKFKLAIKESPGPSSIKQYAVLYLKGIAMGAADIVPGVSGGTIAFITGIYKDLLNAIKSIDINVIKNLLLLKPILAISKVHIRFLATIFFGIITSVLFFSHIIKYLLENNPTELWAFFFGLIIASIIVIIKKTETIKYDFILAMILGTVSSYLIIGLVPVETPNTWWFIILAGALAICAMILPGISGAFILLLLSKYEFLVNAISNPLQKENLLIIALFIFGCFIGITSFSRLVTLVLNKYYNVSIGFLAGFVIGSLRKVWPWKEVIEQKTADLTNYVLVERNILPDANNSMIFQLFLILIGFSFVYFINKFAEKRKI